MSDIRPILPETALHHGFAPASGLPQARRRSTVPVLIAEVPTLLPLYPLAFAPGSDGKVELVAVLGLVEGENHFLDAEDRWVVSYIPSALRGYPFALLPGDNGERHVGFDHASGLYREEPDPARGDRGFFEPSGEPVKLLKDVETFLRSSEEVAKVTKRSVAILAASGVLVPWAFPERLRVGTPPPGLLRVDQTALHGLEALAAARLLKANALALAYAQVFSTQRLAFLGKLRDRQVTGVDADREALEKAGAFFDDGDFDLDLSR